VFFARLARQFIPKEIAMPKYVDGFVLAVPKNKIKIYKKMAQAASKMWKKHGALEYNECLGDDMNVKFGLPFPKLVKPKKGETIVFAYIVYKSRKHRDRVNKKVMSDPGMNDMCDPKDMPFDVKRMAYGGFNVMVAA
jgi:uncharacterized protein YbaA (DUF1428 family)